MSEVASGRIANWFLNVYDLLTLAHDNERCASNSLTIEPNEYLRRSAWRRDTEPGASRGCSADTGRVGAWAARRARNWAAPKRFPEVRTRRLQREW